MMHLRHSHSFLMLAADGCTVCGCGSGGDRSDGAELVTCDWGTGEIRKRIEQNIN